MSSGSSVLVAVIASVPMLGWGADGTWITQGGGDWSDSANWSAAVVASGPGAIANAQGGWTSSLFLELDADFTVGKLTYRDNGTVNRNGTLQSAGGHVLTMAGGGIQSPPEVEAANRRLTVDVPLAGDEGVLFRSSQSGYQVRVSKVCTYTGGTTVAPGAGTLEVFTGGVLGEGTVTVQDDGDPADVDLVLLHAGALVPGTAMILEANAKVDLIFSGAAVPLLSLRIAGVDLASGVYDATTHPAAISGAGSFGVLTGPVASVPPPAVSDGAIIDTTTVEMNWTDSAMWSGGMVAYGEDRLADFANGLNHGVTKNVDLELDVVIGEIHFRDSGGVNRDLILKSGSGRGLTMATSTGTPRIWARNRSIYVDVAISGDDGLVLESEQSTQPGVVLRQRNDYSGTTIIRDKAGVVTVREIGDFGSSDVVVEGNLADSLEELVLEHARALHEGNGLSIETGGKIALDFGNAQVGVGDQGDLFVGSLTLGGVLQSAGIYNASSHPTYFTGTGEVIVQYERDALAMAISSGGAGMLDVTWESLYGMSYVLEESTDLEAAEWTALATEPGLPPTNAVAVTIPAADAAFYRVGESKDYLSVARAGVIARMDGFISNNYLVDQNTNPTDIRFGQFHNSDNMRQSECTPVLVWSYLQPDSAHYQNAAALESAIRSVDYMVRAQGINGGFNENHGWCGVPVRTNGKSSVTGFTLHAIGAAIEMMAPLPEMQARFLENIDANGTGSLDTQRLAAWKSMMSQAMPYQFSGSGRGHAPNQDLCALMAIYKINDAFAALDGGTLLKTQAEIDVLSNEIFYGQPSAASLRPNGEWFSSTGMLGEGGHDFWGYDGNYGAGVTMTYLGLLGPVDSVAQNFLTTKYAEALQYFYVPDSRASLGVFAENAIARRSTGDPLNPTILPIGLAHGGHPAMERLYEIALPHFAAAPEENMAFGSPHMFQVGAWNYCEWIDRLAPAVESGYLLPAERVEEVVYYDETMKTLVVKPEGGVMTYYAEIWDDPNQARRHTWNEEPETITTMGIFP